MTQKNQLVRVNLKLPESVHAKMKVWSFENGYTLQHGVEKLVADFVRMRRAPVPEAAYGLIPDPPQVLSGAPKVAPIQAPMQAPKVVSLQVSRAPAAATPIPIEDIDPPPTEEELAAVASQLPYSRALGLTYSVAQLRIEREAERLADEEEEAQGNRDQAEYEEHLRAQAAASKASAAANSDQKGADDETIQ